MATATANGFLTSHRTPLGISIVVHLLLLAAISTNLVLLPSKPLPQLAIEAVLVDPADLNRSAQENAQQRELERQKLQRQQEQLAAERQAEIKRQELEKQQKAEVLREQQKATEAQRVKVEQQKAAQLEADRKAAEQVQQEKVRKAADAKAAEAKRAADAKAAEAKRAADAKAAEAKRVAAAKAEAERRDQARLQAELSAAMEEEEALFAARSSGELNRYMALIQQKVERNWVRPPSAVSGLECIVAVSQLPNGDVVDARTTSCNGNAAVERSIEAAVRRSSPLPLPDNRALFDRNLRFVFKPEE